MDFSDHEIRALAAFLARRLTPDLKPTDPTDAPVYGDTPFDRWEHTLRRARATGRLARVFREAARAMPSDPALVEACALVDAQAGPERASTGKVLMLATAALMLVSFGGVVTSLAMAAFAGRTAAHVASLDPEVPTLQALGVPAVQVAVSSRFEDSSDRYVPTSPGHVGPRALAPLVAPLLSAVEATPVSREGDGPPEGPLERRAVAEQGPCKVDGWVYAGTEAPRERFVAPHALHVRAEPPSEENGWNSRTPIRCYLGKGDIVRLEDSVKTDAVLELPGHHYWVHLEPDDVIRPIDLAMK